MAPLRQVTDSEVETLALAERIAAELRPGDVIALCGDLGAGKTRFVAGAARGLGYAGRVRSPTFTLLNVYAGRCPIYHFDLYRWDPRRSGDEVDEWREWMEGAGVSFIEWAARLGRDLPARALGVHLAHAGGTRRSLRLRVAPERRAAFARCLAGEDG